MAVNSKHPSYALRLADWELLRDAFEGERAIKERGAVYLPPTPGQLLDGYGVAGSVGQASYDAYKSRAVFPEYVGDAVAQHVGTMWTKPPKIELPDSMKPLLDNASSDGMGLQALLRRINVCQLRTGRLGLLVDLPEQPDPANPLPYVAVYEDTAIINWDTSRDNRGRDRLELVVLDETAYRRTAGLDWERVERYRVLRMQSNTYEQALVERGGELDSAASVAPVLRGKSLDAIPFFFINTQDTLAEPDKPPLLGLARRCLTIYRGEADYRHTLFMQGQETLVTIGGILENDLPVAGKGAEIASDGVRVGAGARLDINMGGDAKFIGVSAAGLSEQRAALEADTAAANALSGVLVSPTAGKQESGDALSTRLTAQTVSLRQIALTGAAALQSALRVIAKWLGQDPEKVIVEPNLEFVDKTLTAEELVKLMTARTMGAPLSLQSIHNTLVARGLTELTLEEELELIAEEDADLALRTAANVAKAAKMTGTGPEPVSD